MVIWPTSLLFAAALQSPLDFGAKEWRDLTFKDVRPAAFRVEPNPHHLLIDVQSSASARILAFDSVQRISHIEFHWQLKGEVPKLASEDQEASKAGDDFALRIGLLLKGQTISLPWFTPTWVQMLAGILKLPSNELIHYVVSAQHDIGARWPSPFSDSIRYVAIDRVTERRKVGFAATDFAKPLDIVGLWIMADGDNTKSRFNIKVKDLVLR